jgi:protein TonB
MAAEKNNILADWDNVVYSGRNEIVFENKNRSYGAYLLRTTYNKTVSKAVIFSVAFLVFCLLIPTIVAYIQSLKTEEVVLKEDNTVDLMDAPPVDPDEPPPPPVEPPPPVQETIKFVPPVVTNEEVPEEDIPPTQEELKESNAGVTTQEGSGDVVDLPIDEPKNEVIEDPADNQVFVSVEEMPKFPGGDEALLGYLSKSIQFPALEKENGISGTVYVYFVINKDGNVEDTKVMRGVKGGSGLDKEALRVINAMPKWSPGRNNGRPAKVQFTLPIKFTLR